MTTLELIEVSRTEKSSLVTLSTVVKFASSSLTSAGVVVGCGWMTSLSTVMYAASLSLLTFAFLPFMLIAFGIALPFLMAALVVLSVIVSVVGALFGAPASPADPSLIIDGTVQGYRMTRFGAKILDPYYRWLSRTRHPILWGSVFGTILGAGILWALITWVVLPGEARTVKILVATREAVIERFKNSKQLPLVTDGHLLYKDLAINLPGPVVDGFGQPLEFDVNPPSFRLRSRGFDQRPGTDDFCVTGEVELNRLQQFIRWGKVARELVKDLDLKVENGKLKVGGHLGLRDAAKLITELRCTES